MTMGRQAGAAAVVLTMAGVIATGSAPWPEPPALPRVPSPAPTPPTPEFPARPDLIPPGVSPVGTEPPAAPIVPHSIGDLAFFEGRWVGKVGDNVVEEQWSGARGSSMMGMFRWLVADGSPYMFELMTMTQEEGAVVLRLRHFGAGLEAKEEKDKPMVMRLGEVEAGKRAVFVAGPGEAGQASRVVYERTGAGTLRFTLHFVEGAGREAFTIEFEREREEGE